MSHLRSRLIEKLKHIAAKRGEDSPQAEELKRQIEADASAEAPKTGAVEKPKAQENK